MLAKGEKPTAVSGEESSPLISCVRVGFQSHVQIATQGGSISCRHKDLKSNSRPSFTRNSSGTRSMPERSDTRHPIEHKKTPLPPLRAFRKNDQGIKTRRNRINSPTSCDQQSSQTDNIRSRSRSSLIHTPTAASPKASIAKMPSFALPLGSSTFRSDSSSDLTHCTSPQLTEQDSSEFQLTRSRTTCDISSKSSKLFVPVNVSPKSSKSVDGSAGSTTSTAASSVSAFKMKRNRGVALQLLQTAELLMGYHKDSTLINHRSEVTAFFLRVRRTAEEGLSPLFAAKLLSIPANLGVVPPDDYIDSLWICIESPCDHATEFDKLPNDVLSSLAWALHKYPRPQTEEHVQKALNVLQDRNIVQWKEACQLIDVCAALSEEDSGGFSNLVDLSLQVLREGFRNLKTPELVVLISNCGKLKRLVAKHHPLLEGIANRIHIKLPAVSNPEIVLVFTALSELGLRDTLMTPPFEFLASSEAGRSSGSSRTSGSSKLHVPLHEEGERGGQALPPMIRKKSPPQQPTKDFLTARVPLFSSMLLLELLWAASRLDYRHPALVDSGSRLNFVAKNKDLSSEDCLKFLRVSIWLGRPVTKGLLTSARDLLPQMTAEEIQLLYKLVASLESLPQLNPLVPLSAEDVYFPRACVEQAITEFSSPELVDFFLNLQKLFWPKEDNIVSMCAVMLSKCMFKMSYKELCMSFVASLHFGVSDKFDYTVLKKCQSQQLWLESETVLQVLKTLADTCSDSDDIQENALIILQGQNFEQSVQKFSAVEATVYIVSCRKLKWAEGLTPHIFEQISNIVEKDGFEPQQCVEILWSTAAILPLAAYSDYRSILERVAEIATRFSTELSDLELAKLLNSSGKLDVSHDMILKALGNLHPSRLKEVKRQIYSLSTPDGGDDEDDEESF